MNNTIKVLFIITVLLGGVIYLSNKNIKSIEEEVNRIEQDTQNKQAILNNLLQKYDDKVAFEMNDDTPSSDELIHILPRYFDWNEVVFELDQIEMKVGIEAYKNVTKSELSNFEIYKGLTEYINVTTVNLNFTVENQEYGKIGNFIGEIQSLNKSIIIDEISYSYPGEPYLVNIKLLYFTFES